MKVKIIKLLEQFTDSEKLELLMASLQKEDLIELCKGVLFSQEFESCIDLDWSDHPALKIVIPYDLFKNTLVTWLNKQNDEKQKELFKELLLAGLNRRIFHIQFIKKSGEKRDMECTLWKLHLLENKAYTEYVEQVKKKSGSSDQNKPDPNNVLVWDLQNNGWRKIPLERIVSIKII